MNNRFFVFDFIRAAACIFVLIGHWACFYLNYEEFYIPIKIHQIGVGMFFFISGYLMCISVDKNTFKTFAIQRFFRLVPSIISVGVITATIMQLAPRGILHFFTAISFMGDVVDVKGALGMPMWTLHVETKFYFILAISFFAERKFNINFIKKFIILSFLLILLTAIWSFYTKISVDFASLLYNSVCVLFVFLGTLYYMYEKKYINTKYLYILFGIISLIAMILSGKLILWNVNIDHQNYYYFFTPFNHFFGVIVALICIKNAHFFKKNSIISFFADISYPVYLSHFCILLKYKYSGILISIVISFVVHKLVEQPFIDYGKKLTSKKI